MRATSLLKPAPHAALNRRRLAALIALATLTCTQSATTVHARDGLTLAPHLSQVLWGQGGATLRPGESKKKKAPPAKAKVNTVEVDPALTRDKTALPPGYQVPPQRLPDLDAGKELPLPVKKGSKEPGYDEWRKHIDLMKKYNTLLRKGNFEDAKAEREILRYGIKFKLAQMTQKNILFPSDEDREKVQKAQEEEKRVETPPTIEKYRDEILSDLHNTNAFNGGMEIRDAFLDILCDEAPKLLDNNFYVRFNVALILSTIVNREEDRTKPTAEEPCFRAIKPLLDLVNDPKQNPMYKVHPVLGLARICRHKNCKPEDRFAIIETLLNQMALAKPPQPEWYAMRIAESLALLGDPNDRTRQPVVVDGLMKVLKDPEYTYRVRAQAAHSLGRIPLDGYRKADEIAVEMLRLGNQMAVEYEKSPKNPVWKLYFAYLYLGFQPRDTAERNEKKGLLVQVDTKPVLAGTKTVVNEAYQHFLPLAQNVLGGKAAAPIPDQLRKIKVWLDARGKPAAGTPVAEKGK